MGFFNYDIDTHIHTEATAPYLKGDSNLKPYHDAGKRANLNIMCVTDHFHYIWQNPKYLAFQRDFINKNVDTSPKILLGAEHTILNHKGNVGIRKKTIPLLDLVNLSVHWFGMGTPGFFGGTRLREDDMNKVRNYFKENNPKGRQFLKYSTNAFINSLHSPKLRNVPKIICHPWDEYISSGIFLPEMIEDAELIFAAIKEENAAYEFNNGTCSNLLSHLEQSANEDNIANEIYQIPVRDFILDLFKLISKYQVWISVSSDAHKLENIGRLDSSIQLIEEFGQKVNLDGVKLVNDDFFNR
jgi:histidinol phosphatase-like PHP family hydrolase